MPHHDIIIHLEQRPDPEFNNVVVLKFGPVVYQQKGEVTDINLRIMRWIVFESGFAVFLLLDPRWSGASTVLSTGSDGCIAAFGTQGIHGRNQQRLRPGYCTRPLWINWTHVFS
jgi:hypothetical protein